MKKREADFGLLFRHWLKANHKRFGTSCGFELKQTTTDSISFKAVKDHQSAALVASSSGVDGLLYKAPDDSRGIKPFDYFYLKNALSYVVIRYPKAFHVIPIWRFLQEESNSKRKSLTEARAREISYVSHIFKKLADRSVV